MSLNRLFNSRGTWPSRLCHSSHSMRFQLWLNFSSTYFFCVPGLYIPVNSNDSFCSISYSSSHIISPYFYSVLVIPLIAEIANVIIETIALPISFPMSHAISQRILKITNDSIIALNINLHSFLLNPFPPILVSRTIFLRLICTTSKLGHIVRLIY